jgi:hypothetical protein
MDKTEIFLKKCVKIHGVNKYDFSKVKFVNSKTKINLTCLICNYNFEALPENIFKMKNCKICTYKNLKQNQKKSNDWFLEKVKLVHKDKYSYLNDYLGAKSVITIKCNICNNIFNQRASSHLEGFGCKKCADNLSTKTQRTHFLEFEKKCDELHNNKYIYFNDFVNNKSRLKIQCKTCLNIFEQSVCGHYNKKQGCPICKFSKGEVVVQKYLDINNINYETQKKFKDCRNKLPLRFDFYLPDYNTCVEFDGLQHFVNVSIFKNSFEYVANNDKIKQDYCNSKNIKLLRISYKEIKNVCKILDNFILNFKN